MSKQPIWKRAVSRAHRVSTLSLGFGVVLLAAQGDLSYSGGSEIVGNHLEGGEPAKGVKIVVTTDKTSYAPDEPIMMCLEVTNQTEEVVTFKFSSGQRYDFLIEDAAGHTVWRWATDKGFIQMLGEQRVAPGQVLTYRERFDGILPPRTYTVVGILVASNRPLRASTTITVR